MQLTKLGHEFGVYRRGDGRLIVKYRDHTDRLRQVTTFTRVADANSFVLQAYRKWPGATRVSVDWGIAEMVSEYLAEREGSHLLTGYPAATTLERDRAGAKRIRAQWPDQQAVTLSRRQVKDWYDAMRGDGLTDNSIRNYASVLSGAYRWAIDSDQLDLASPPVPGVRVKSVKHGQALTVEQIRAICEATAPAYRTFMETLAWTGMRIEEVCQLDVGSVDPKRRLITGGLKTEAGRNRKIKVPRFLMVRIEPLLEDRPAESPLFLNRLGNRVSADVFRKRIWGPAVETAGIPEATPHWMRHSVATLQASLGATSWELRSHFGWKDSRPADLYVKVAQDGVDAMADRLEALGG